MSSVSIGMAAGELQISLAKLQLDAVKEQGRAALNLIKATAPPEVKAQAPVANAPAGVGTHLNVVA